MKKICIVEVFRANVLKRKGIERKIGGWESENMRGFSAIRYYPSGQALILDSLASRRSTIASSVQFKPIKNGENLVVNYNL